MARGLQRHAAVHNGLFEIEDALDGEGRIVLPPGATMISLIDRNIANVGEAVAFRYLDYTRSDDGDATEVTWSQFGVRIQALAARLQRVTTPGDRVAILAPQGIDYVAGFFSALKAGTVAVPLFAPELPGHAERLDTALHDAQPTAILTTTAGFGAVEGFLAEHARLRGLHVVVIDEVSNSEGAWFAPIELDLDGVSHLQYTSGATRPPVGVEITHRAVGTNLLQMILAIGLHDRNIHGLSWLPLYHDMGLSMLGFPTVYGGHSTLMSPTAFIRRPQRWIHAMSDRSRVGGVVTAAPNFAYEWTAQRGRPAAGADIDLGNVRMIIGSEPVSIEAIKMFTEAFGPYGLPRTAIKPSYGVAEATLMVSTITPTTEAAAVHLDREQLAAGRAVPVGADAPEAMAHVPCGQIARSLWCVVVDADGNELPDGYVGETWLQGNNVAQGYWGRPDDTRFTFGARLRSTLGADSRAAGSSIDGAWLRTGDLGFYLDGEIYVAGRIADLVTIDGRQHYPHDIEATVAEASPAVRRGYIAAFSVPPAGADDADDRLVIIAERAAGTSRADPGVAVDAIRAAVSRRHRVAVTEVGLLPAGSIPRTTSGKLARQACRSQYLDETLRIQ
jgi:fatty-acyl-CoA synthase